MRDGMTQEEQILYYVRTLDANALERALWKITPGTLELKNITTSGRTPCNLSNKNKGMNFETLPHGWWVDNGCFGISKGYKMHPEIHSVGSVLHVLTSMYYEIGISIFRVPLLETYKKVFKVLLDHGADPNHQLMDPWVKKEMYEKIHSDITGQTPLHFAVAQFDVEGVKVLLAAGANPTLEHEGCKTVVQMVEDQKKTLEQHVNYDYYTKNESLAQDATEIYDLIMKFK